MAALVVVEVADDDGVVVAAVEGDELDLVELVLLLLPQPAKASAVTARATKAILLRILSLHHWHAV
jgi:hypothetical protein